MVFPSGMIEIVRVIKSCHPEPTATARIEGSTNGITANLAVIRRFLDYARNDIPVSYAKDLTVLLKDNYQFLIINYLSVQQNDKLEFEDGVNFSCYFGKDSVYCLGNPITPAGVMELVDVVDSKSTAGDSVPVRVRSPAPKYGIPHRGVSHIFMPVSRQTRTVGESLAVSPSAASGGCSEGAVCAAVDKIEEKRKPEDFIGHRKRTPAPEKARFGVLFQLNPPSRVG